MKNNVIRTTTVAIAFMIVLSSFMMICTSAINIQSNNDIAEEKVYCNANIDDDFADDTVLVILKNDISVKCDTFTINDFADINPSSIKHLSMAMESRIKSAMDSILDSVTTGIQVTIDDSPNIDEFNQVLSIKLSETGKDKVLAAIEVLERVLLGMSN